MRVLEWAHDAAPGRKSRQRAARPGMERDGDARTGGDVAVLRKRARLPNGLRRYGAHGLADGGGALRAEAPPICRLVAGQAAVDSDGRGPLPPALAVTGTNLQRSTAAGNPPEAAPRLPSTPKPFVPAIGGGEGARPRSELDRPDRV